MTTSLNALHSSVARLRLLVEGLDESELTARAYPAEWTIAQVLSHLGSGAVIMKQRVSDVAEQTKSSEDFNTSVWDTWNAKSPAEQAADELVADQALMDALDEVTDAQRESFRHAIGPMTLDFDETVKMRLGEHALHLWDVEVVFDPSVGLSPDSVPPLVDNLSMIVRFAGKPTGTEQKVSVRTNEPRRDFTIEIGTEYVVLESASLTERPDVELPAEALVRLVYGRLDPAHTPPINDDGKLEVLRSVFQGF